jgi:hypothetical protein
VEIYLQSAGRDLSGSHFQMQLFIINGLVAWALLAAHPIHPLECKTYSTLLLKIQVAGSMAFPHRSETASSKFERIASLVVDHLPHP